MSGAAHLTDPISADQVNPINATLPEDRVALTPRGVRVLAIAHGEVAAGMD